MDVQEQIQKYITSQPEPKRSDMQELHQHILKALPKCKLWFLDGKNSENKTVSNPNIGYGFHTINRLMKKPESFIKLVSVQTKLESLSIYLVLMIRHT